jgi:hypothetical protein
MSSEGDALREWVDDNIEFGLTADGFDEAIIGIGERCGQPPLVAYDRDKCIELLAEQFYDDEDPYTTAVEYFEFNVVGAWMGENTPIFITRPE